MSLSALDQFGREFFAARVVNKYKGIAALEDLACGFTAADFFEMSKGFFY